MRHYFKRHQPKATPKDGLLLGLGVAAALAVIGLLGSYGHMLPLMAAFGPSLFLILSAPSNPLSQPINVVGGHAVATLIGLGLRMVWPNEWWAIALAVGLAVFVMGALRVSHPPAFADPIVIFLTDPGLSFFVSPVLLGSITCVILGLIYHRLKKHTYPLRLER